MKYIHEIKIKMDNNVYNILDQSSKHLHIETRKTIRDDVVFRIMAAIETTENVVHLRFDGDPNKDGEL